MMQWMQWLLPFFLLLGGLIAGVFFEKFVFKNLKDFANKTQFIGNELIFASLQGKPKLWFFLAGIYGAILTLPISPNVSVILQKIITAIILYTVTLVFAKIAAGFMTLYGQRIEGLSASLFANLVRILVLAFGILIILESLGINLTPILATLGIGGLVVALAFQETLSNLYSGLYLIISGQVRNGDYVKLGTGEEGYIMDITWRNTTIKELANNIIVVPNNKLASAIFKNYHLPAKEINLQISVGISYDSNLELVEKVTLEVANEVMQNVVGGVPNFDPFIRYHELADFKINCIVFLKVVEFLDQRLVKHEFIKRLHKRYQEENIEFPFTGRNNSRKNLKDEV